MGLNDGTAIVAGYLLGAIPFGYLLVKVRHGFDVRTTGSGATGATNVTRAAGPAVGLLVLLLDAAKGYGAVWLADSLTTSDERWVSAAAVAAILGHSFPVFLGFRGGKSVATGAGVFFYLTPLAVPASFVVWLVVMSLTRYVALSSILAAAAFAPASYLLYHPAPSVQLAVVVGATIIILRHRSNIERLIAGTESKMRFGRRES